MFNFREFIAEGGYNVPVVSLSKEKVNLDEPSTRNEINRNLTAELSHDWMNPYGGWYKIRKVLSMYGISLPKVIFQDAEEGEEVVAISQFGDKIGANLDGSINMDPQDSDYYLYYSYGIGESGFYEAFAVITDEEGLDELISDDLDDAEIDTDDVTPEEQLNTEE